MRWFVRVQTTRSSRCWFEWPTSTMRSPSSRTYRDLSWRPCRPTLRRVPACTSWWHRTPTKEASSDTFWSLVVIIVVNCFSYYNNLHFIRRRNVVGVTAVYEFRLLRFVSHMWSAKIKQFRQLETNFAVKFRCISVMRPATTTLEHAPAVAVSCQWLLEIGDRGLILRRQLLNVEIFFTTMNGKSIIEYFL